MSFHVILPVGTAFHDSISHKVYELMIQILWKYVLFFREKYWWDQITNLHMSWQLTCENLWHDLIIRIQIRANWIYPRFQLWTHGHFVERSKKHCWLIVQHLPPSFSVGFCHVHCNNVFWERFWHIEAETKLSPFRRRHFQMHFLEGKCLNIA